MRYNEDRNETGGDVMAIMKEENFPSIRVSRKLKDETIQAAEHEQENLSEYIRKAVERRNEQIIADSLKRGGQIGGNTMLRMEKTNVLMEKVLKLNEKYEELMDAINREKSNGDLAKLFNLKREFDETFDQFFDNYDLRKKYDDWDYEEDCIKMEKSNSDLLKELDEEDLKSYIEFYENYIGELEDELNELRD